MSLHSAHWTFNDAICPGPQRCVSRCVCVFCPEAAQHSPVSCPRGINITVSQCGGDESQFHANPSASHQPSQQPRHQMSARWTIQNQKGKLISSATHTDNAGCFPLHPFHGTRGTSLLSMDTHPPTHCDWEEISSYWFCSVEMMELNKVQADWPLMYSSLVWGY